MVALLTLLSSKKSSKGDIKPGWLNPAVSSLLSQQVARPGGILGILNVMIGRAEQGRSPMHSLYGIRLTTSPLAEVQFAQLEQIARLITTPSKGTELEVSPDQFSKGRFHRLIKLRR